ncbi:MAG: GMC family oxidoreductase [Elusimicrobia bacterium]|nr:GMC family oxidoreductase [Elusimicrobiota bacterium]
MIEKEFDIVIIGSGAGGGAVAKELSPLCKEGVKIAVLEWGPKFKETDFTGQELEMANKLYFDGGGFLTRDKSMTFAFAKAYGGSTVVYTGTSLTIPRETVSRWGVPGLEWEDIKRRSQKYLQENNVHLLEEDHLNDNNKLFYRACRNLNYKVEQFPINVRDCQGSGMCNLGCPNAAKQGTHRVQLPAAEKNGVIVVTNCKVNRIQDRVCYATVSNPGVGYPSVWEPGEYRVKAKMVVAAAGAVNTPALLFRSHLPTRLPALGRYFTCHPAFILVAQHSKPITNYWGHPKSYYCDHFVESKKFLLETCMYFPFTTAKNLAGFGQEHSRMVSRMDTLQMILVLALDPALPENRVTIDREGNPVVEYRLTEPVLDSLFESIKVCARIFFAAGAERVHAPAGKKFFVESSEQDNLDELIVREELKVGKVSITTAHLMGGCRMGEDLATSVTDVWGQVHGVPWLFVADASLFPQCAEINPYITIMALADRVAERVKSRLASL